MARLSTPTSTTPKTPLLRLALWYWAADIVRAAYAGLLRRDPDERGLETYTRGLRKSGQLAALLRDMAASQEAWERCFELRSAELVRRMFVGLLGRDPDESELADGMARLRDPGCLPEVLATIAGSREHWESRLRERGAELLRTCYRAILEEEPTAAALQPYLDLLADTGDLAHTLSLLGSSPVFLNRLIMRCADDLLGAPSEELRHKLFAARATDLVQAAFRGLLGRDAEAEAVAAYGRKIRESGDLSATLAEIVQSSEFRQKSGGQPARSGANPAATYDARTWVFLHIQKTAGSSLRLMLQEAFRGQKFYSTSLDELYLHSPSELCAYRVFAGHFNHDSLHYIPRRSLSIFTFVRDPRERLLSLYYYWRSHEPTHPLYANGPKAANELGLGDFFASDDVIKKFGLWNHMAWAIMGKRTWQEWRELLSPAAGQPSQDILANRVRPAVRERLREFVCVGLQEEFSRSVSLLFRRLNRRQPTLQERNITERLGSRNRDFKARLDREPVTEAANSALARLVQIDDIIYEEARLHFEKLCAEYPDGVRPGALSDTGT